MSRNKENTISRVITDNPFQAAESGNLKRKIFGQSPNTGKPPLSWSKINWLDRWIVKKMMELVGNPPVVVRLWDQKAVTAAVDNSVASITYRNRRALLKTIVDPDLHWGDLYSSGELEFEGDLVRFLETVVLNMNAAEDTGWFRRFVWGLTHRPNINSHNKSKENIYHHYDIGNDFYKLWLDRDHMQYTCAYFPDPKISLEEAQAAKMHHVCRKLQLKPGDKVVEAGCGWGGLARFMAKHYGVHVRAFNISREQVEHARGRAKAENLLDRVEYVLDDYRNITGEYDVFVSVGMLEHVGMSNYETLGQVINRCLKPEGRGLIHSVGRNRPMKMNAWLERRIFPGAHPPSISEMMQIFEPNGLSVLDVENLRLHYAKTLDQWAERFESHRQEIEATMGEEFVRAWRLYLVGTASSFRVGDLQLFQIVFANSRNNDIPWTRTHQYQSETRPSVDKREIEHA